MTNDSFIASVAFCDERIFYANHWDGGLLGILIKEALAAARIGLNLVSNIGRNIPRIIWINTTLYPYYAFRLMSGLGLQICGLIHRNQRFGLFSSSERFCGITRTNIKRCYEVIFFVLSNWRLMGKNSSIIIVFMCGKFGLHLLTVEDCAYIGRKVDVAIWAFPGALRASEFKPSSPPSCMAFPLPCT